MSATNRGSERDGRDNYPTPAWCTRRIIDACAQQYDARWPGFYRPLSIIEPCAGEGAIVRVVRELLPDAEITANDIRDTGADLVRAGADYAQQGDYLESAKAPYALGITNPPFAIAEAVVQTMLTNCTWVVVLVRQGFVGHERAAWMRTNMPDTFELPDRPGFVASLKCLPNKGEDDGCGWASMQPLDAERPKACPGCGLRRVLRTTSDAADYCWLVWGPVRNRTEGRRVILPSTSPEERGVKARTRKALP